MENWNRIFSIGVGSIGIIVNRVWGGNDTMFIALISFMTLDFLTALICGFRKCELDSNKAYVGITQKKMMILIMVAVSVIVDRIMNTEGTTRSLVIFYYISMEGISILETAGKLDFPIPSKLKDALAQLNKED